MTNIPDDIADELLSELPLLMSQHRDNPNGADWNICLFCAERASDTPTQYGQIKHAPNCLGVRLRAALE